MQGLERSGKGSLVAGIAQHFFESLFWHLANQAEARIAVVDGGGCNRRGPDAPLRIDGDMALSSVYFLCRVDASVLPGSWSQANGL